MKTFRLSLFLLLLIIAGVTPERASLADSGDQYEIVPRGSNARGHFWVSDGPVDIYSTTQSFGNRFRVGGEAQLGTDYRIILGGTAIDLLSSGETSPLVGNISRIGFDLNVGYFFVPDKLWLEYSFYLGTIHGSFIGGQVGNTGHSLELGYRFYDQNDFNLAVSASYLYIFSEATPVFDFQTQTMSTAYYPGASVISLSITAGFDVGGRH